MTGEFIPKRPHKKSRGGCQTCKTKKVKCDEIQPTCTFCAKRNLSCIYPAKVTKSEPSTPSDNRIQDENVRGISPQSDPGPEETEMSWDLVASPSPLVMSASGALSPYDIRMMHQWSSWTSTTIAVGNPANQVLQLVIPQLAFENEYLMNGILGIASLQLQTLVPFPDDIKRQTDLYRAKALTGFRKALLNIVPFSREYEAALIMSVLLVVICSRDYEMEEGQLLVVNWFILYRGLSAVMTMTSFPNVKSLSVGPIFRREFTEVKVIPVVPTALMDMVRSIPIDDPDFDMFEDYCNILDAVGMLYASLQQDGLNGGLYIRVVAWPSFSTHGFSRCASEYRPRALVILSYYLMFVKLSQELWWMQGVADRDIEGIRKMVGPNWLPFMEIPLQVMNLSDPGEIVKVMLA